MYPRNAASPERISIGAVVQISDGAVQTAGVTVRVLPFGGTEADGVGTVAYSTDGVVVYTPTQGETNYTSFVLIAKKTGCIPANVTVVTSESTVSGRVYVATNGDKTGYTATVSDKTGFSLAPTTGLGNQTANITGNLSGSVGSVTGSVGSVVSGVTVSDKTGFSLLAGTGLGAQNGSVALVTKVDELGVNALTANGAVDAIPTAVFSALTTATWPNNSFGKQILIGASTQRTVAVTGSHHVAAVLHDAEPNSIPEDAFVDGALSARVIATDAIDSDAMAASANTEIANAVAATQALSRLDSMIESDGAGQFRFDTIALEQAPAGGGGGGTDWTANERTAIRAILGVPISGTAPTDPTSGILDEIRDSVGAIGINVYPVSASTPERVAGTTLTFYRDESRSVSVVTDFTLTNLTLQFTVEDQDGNDVYALNNASITRSGQTFTVPVTTAVTGGLGQYRWSMRDITGGGNSVISRGVLAVEEAASNG
jgi:hypothetical protein